MLITAILATAVGFVPLAAAENSTRLWYTAPVASSTWTDALPIGNGRLGAMIYGIPVQELIQLNEETIWSGGRRDRVNQNGAQTVSEVRDLLARGDAGGAQKLANLGMMGTPQTCRNYQTLGDMEISFDGTSEYDNTTYERWLDLDTALAGVRFKVNDTLYEREMFVSVPDDVFVHHLKATGNGKLSFQIRVHRPKDGLNEASDQNWNENGWTYMTGGTGGIDPVVFTTALAVESDGHVRTLGEFIVVENATEATAFLAAATSYRHNDTRAAVDSTIQKARQHTYEELRRRHIEDYSPLYNASVLNLNGPDLGTSSLPTNARINATRRGANDPGLVALAYNYGRYLLISSSRAGNLPSNLQGIWNKEFDPLWGSKYTVNINLQMNYWPAEVTSLSSLHEPFFDLLELMRKDGTHTAKAMYNASGWMSHHNTDLWGDTAPVDTYLPATYWTLSSGWLVTHILEHYWYTGDKSFLASNLHIVSEAIEFYLDTLQPYKTNGTEYLVTNPSVSPENTYVGPDGKSYNFDIAPTCDVEILNELFTNYLNAVATLSNSTVDSAFLTRIRDTQAKLPPYRYSTRYPGTLQEWMQDYEQAEPGHRHVSHLYALYPGTQIPPPGAPGYDAKLFNAAAATLEDRLSHNGAGTGWSRAWTINWYARLQNATALAENTFQFFNTSVFNNLMDVNEGIFQIDGNLGFVSGVAEGLLQSHVVDDKGVREVWLLPVLPEEWSDGSVNGIAARGGFVFDLEWADGKLVHMRMESRVGGPVVLKYGGGGNSTTAARQAEGFSNGRMRLETKAGDVREFDFRKAY
ncbi:glycoside hydrolase family 95 protein [Bipolaris maydis ATCC 48331]|uniref:Glycoside hydrolase family 95 protein n=2 Tax=Cochliobolus heterostrophus TaxID=5016 RepID=M2UFI2_COCH5|nr:glycoside hydrolase family 95 protein [Bipolaris maydis ATCC 48331]EMD92466.1 glycoside hydrolase family 95 protein [Bipolaris maydis C5]KAJ5022291.1 glycoside hydrolase [Bipolaris maydis]ENI08160.1 glycoside hydrolase family 95 protein [Bipolaris maydis ATCC 48331]KAJ5060986.1 Six-hairpin glycosidase-like protein [Bipolaris maydis]KAJ6210253.1 glycoside hydrolase family 95 protein [Bipolaris maydis]